MVNDATLNIKSLTINYLLDFSYPDIAIAH
ncbi:MAG: hypothetical protein ACI9XO_002823 [Paraglaciecola sp.]|jgi:hypothetical protein